MACHSHGVEQLPSWPWTQACASHPHTRCTGTWTFDLANGVLVEIRTWGLLGHLTLIQEQRRPLPAGRGGWPLSFWQNVRDRGQVLDGVVQSSYNLPYLSDRAMWTSSIDAKYKKSVWNERAEIVYEDTSLAVNWVLYELDETILFLWNDWQLSDWTAQKEPPPKDNLQTFQNF